MLDLLLLLLDPHPFSQEKREDLARGLISKMKPPLEDETSILIIRSLLLSEQLSVIDLETLVCKLIEKVGIVSPENPMILLLYALLFPDKLSFEQLQTVLLWLNKIKSESSDKNISNNQTPENNIEKIIIRSLLLSETLSYAEIKMLTGELIKRQDTAVSNKAEIQAIRLMIFQEDISRTELDKVLNFLLEREQPSKNKQLDCLLLKSLVLNQELSLAELVTLAKIILPEQPIKGCPEEQVGENTVQISADDSSEVVPPKKRRGRPPKNKTDEVKKPKKKVDKPKHSSDTDNAEKHEEKEVIKDTTLIVENNSLQSKVETEIETSPDTNCSEEVLAESISGENANSEASSAINTFFKSLELYPQLAERANKKECFSYNFVYKADDGNYVLSAWILESLQPIGIYIPYAVNKFKGRYAGFILSLYDEDNYQSVNEALLYLGKEAPSSEPYWWVMHTTQYSILMNIKSTINRMLTEVGGHCLNKTGKYCMVNAQKIYNISSNKGSIRLTCDVPVID